MKIDLVARAIRFAAAAHAKQLRKGSQQPYIIHPMEAAMIMIQMGGSPEYIAAALLHDTVEDCGDCIDEETIRAQFGEDVAMLVDGLTKLVQLKVEDKEEAEIENLRKMFLAMSK
ncbi:MAG: HD domain-containing protein, partial [Clostridia bacterium]|nr:HD domain-containing protein [Clostridia bacterium]